MQRIRLEIDGIDTRLPRYPMSVLFFIMFGSIIEAFDRSLFGILLEDIRREFSASDTQLGFTAGAFGFLAALGVIPIGLLTDRVKRVYIVTLGYIPWAVGMMLQGLAPTFVLFFLARMLTGAMEATNGTDSPAIVSLTGDYYPVTDRNRIFGLLSMGTNLGFVFGPIFGGISANVLGWRGAFFFWGLAGLGTGLAARVLLVEPPRGLQDAKHRLQVRYLELRMAQRRMSPGHDVPATVNDEDHRDAEQIAADTASLTGVPVETLNTFDYRNMTRQQVTRELLRLKSFWALTAVTTCLVFGTSGVATWLPTFYRRYHGMSVTGAAVSQAFSAATTLIGITLGARMGTAMVKAEKPHWRLWVLVVSYVFTAIFWTCALTASFTPFSIHFFILGALAISSPTGLILALRTDLIHPYLRGRAFSVTAVPRTIATLSAPIIFGLISDSVGLRTALLVQCPIFFAMAAISLLAVAWYRPDLTHTQAEAIRQQALENQDPQETEPTQGAGIARFLD